MDIKIQLISRQCTCIIPYSSNTIMSENTAGIRQTTWDDLVKPWTQSVCHFRNAGDQPKQDVQVIVICPIQFSSVRWCGIALHSPDTHTRPLGFSSLHIYFWLFGFCFLRFGFLSLGFFHLYFFGLLWLFGYFTQFPWIRKEVLLSYVNAQQKYALSM